MESFFSNAQTYQFLSYGFTALLGVVIVRMLYAMATSRRISKFWFAIGGYLFAVVVLSRLLEAQVSRQAIATGLGIALVPFVILMFISFQKT